MLSPLTRHIVLPAAAPAAIVYLYFTPISTIGCLNRGLLAVGVVLVSTLGALVTICLALRMKLQNQTSFNWWLVSTLILILPVVLLFGPLG